jgi:hypothetical protein
MVNFLTRKLYRGRITQLRGKDVITILTRNRMYEANVVAILKFKRDRILFFAFKGRSQVIEVNSGIEFACIIALPIKIC